MNRYLKTYTDLGFERAGLFETVQKQSGCMTALYPGSSVHITSSFYIPHVVYVDRDPEAAAFFADMDAVNTYVDRHKHYRRHAHLQFIDADYTRPLPLPDHSFDLLIALFAGPVFEACRRYLRPGGLLLTNSFQLDSETVLRAGYQLHSSIRYHKGAYRLNTGYLKEQPGRAGKTANRRYLQPVNDGLVYRETDTYFLFAKV